MEILQPHFAILQIVVAIHAGEQYSHVAAQIEMNVANSLGIVQRAGESDGIVHIAGDGLVRGHQGCQILHAHPHRIGTKVDFLFPRKAHKAIHIPGLLPVFLQREVLYGYSVQTPQGMKAQ